MAQPEVPTAYCQTMFYNWAVGGRVRSRLMKKMLLNWKVFFAQLAINVQNHTSFSSVHRH